MYRLILVALLSATPDASPVSHAWTLTELTDAAQNADPRVLAAVADVHKLQSLQRQANAAALPTIFFAMAGGGPLPEAYNDPEHLDDVSPASRLRTGRLGQLGYLLHAEVTAALPLYTFGKISAYQDAAGSGVAAMSRLLDESRNQAVRDATEVFWGYQLARHTLSGMHDGQAQLAEATQRLNTLLASHSTQVQRTDLDKVEIIKAELNTHALEAEAGRDVALAAGRMLAGVNPDTPFALQDVELPQADSNALRPVDHYTAAAFTHRPEILAARHAVQAQEALLRAKERDYYPDVLLAGGASWNYANVATPQTNPFAYDPYNSRSAALGLMVRGSLDVMQKYARVTEAQAELEKAVAQQELAERWVHLEVVKAHGALREALGRVKQVSIADTASHHWATSSMVSFDAGGTDAQDVLVAAMLAARSGAAQLQARHDVALRYADLTLAVGTDTRSLP